MWIQSLVWVNSTETRIIPLASLESHRWFSKKQISGIKDESQEEKLSINGKLESNYNFATSRSTIRDESKLQKLVPRLVCKAPRSQCTSGLFRCFWLSHMQFKEKYFSQDLWLLKKISVTLYRPLYRLPIHVISKIFFRIKFLKNDKIFMTICTAYGKAPGDSSWAGGQQGLLIHIWACV